MWLSLVEACANRLERELKTRSEQTQASANENLQHRTAQLPQPGIVVTTNHITRNRDHTTALFEKHGMVNVGYWTNAIGGRSDELVYILGFQDLAQRDRVGDRREVLALDLVAAAHLGEGVPLDHAVLDRIVQDAVEPAPDLFEHHRGLVLDLAQDRGLSLIHISEPPRPY